MKAIQLTAYGHPAQNLKAVDLPELKAPSAHEALVRMEYAPIAYSDLLLANGVYLLRPKLPSVIGGEGAGIVEAIGRAGRANSDYRRLGGALHPGWQHHWRRDT